MKKVENLEEIDLLSLSFIRNNHDVKHFFKAQGLESVKDFLEIPLESVLASNKRYSYEGIKDKIRGIYDLINYKFLDIQMPVTVKLNSKLTYNSKRENFEFQDVTLERLGFSTTEKYLIERYIKSNYKVNDQETTLIDILKNFLLFIKRNNKTSLSVTLEEKITMYLNAYLVEKSNVEKNALNIELQILRSNIDNLYNRRESLNHEISKYQNNVKISQFKDLDKEIKNR